MNELKRTAVFVAIAVVLSAITYLTMPSTEKQSPADMVGKNLFSKFEDPLEATSLEVVKFDQETATANAFKVAKIGNSWVIPSHNDYPADAEDQLADVAAEWIGVEVLGVATDPEESGIQSDDIHGLHDLYGVIDPVGEDSGNGEGVGTRVVMRDKSDAELVRLIVGKEVEDQHGLRYVRLIGQDPVYTVEVSTSKLSTKFEDWIEDDLLKLSSWDIRKVDIDDYSIDILQGFITPRGQISLDHNDTGDPRWTLAVDREYSKDGWADRGLAENEELNADTLNDLKSALDDLKIVDVVRKPKGLSDTLKSSGSIKLDPEAERSLSRAGFHVIPVSDPNDPGRQYNDLRSNEGQISASMKDGVKYVLRFGQIAGMGSDEGEEKEEKEDAETEETDTEKEEPSGAKVNRYLFVMVQMDRSMIEEPEYEALPELPSDELNTEESKADEPKTEEGNGEEPKADDAKEEKSEEPKVEQTEPEEAKAEEAKEEKPEEAEADDAKEEDGKADPEKAEEKEEQPKPTREEIEKQREEIQKENDRKKEEYEEKIKEGEDKVKELNARFADWYYIIDDGEYQKIHLSRDKIVKEKEKEEDESEGDASVDMPAAPVTEPDSIGEFESLKLEAPAKE